MVVDELQQARVLVWRPGPLDDVAALELVEVRLELAQVHLGTLLEVKRRGVVRQTVDVRGQRGVVRGLSGEAMGQLLLLGGHARRPERRKRYCSLDPRLLERFLLDPPLQTRLLEPTPLPRLQGSSRLEGRQAQSRVRAGTGSANGHERWAG